VHFRIFTFNATLAALKIASGAGTGEWTAAQVDFAARLVDDAHRSWGAFARASMDAAWESKRAGRPEKRPDHTEMFAAWRRQYFDDARVAQWHVQHLVDSLEP
jgi:hypothetical protein